jgi:hypothetical protein
MVLILFWTLFCLLFVHINCEECGCNKIPSIEIINDEQLANGIEEVRDDFLRRQPPSNFTRLSATILIREKGTQTWKRGSVDGTLIAYPASTVKLMYMYSAMDWCKKQNLAIDCLDRYVRPMVIISSNLDTGYVVDAITNTTNIENLNSTNDTRWSDWYDQRLSTELLLKELDLYANQIVRSKTYPTNSGQSPFGSESVLIASGQRNFLQSCCTASFMLYLMQTRPINELEYMKAMLYRTHYSDQTTFGSGLPAGTIIYSKSGNAYDTVEEIAYIILPNGKEIILSAFSNGFQRPASDFYILGRFVELVIQKFSLDSSSTVIFTSDNQDIYTCTNDAIKNTSSSLPNDIIGQSLITFNNSCILHPVLSQRGVYTVSIWNPSFFDSSTNTNARLNVAVMDAFNFSDGDNGFIYDQQVSSSRWISVGDFVLNPGRQHVYIKSLDQKSVFNAIRFSMHPPLTIDGNMKSKSSIFIPRNIFFLLILSYLISK